MNSVCRFLPVIALFAFHGNSISRAQTFVDIQPPVGRSDMTAPGMYAWNLTKNRVQQLDLGQITLSLRLHGANASMTPGLWKPGYDHPARMISDGVVVVGDRKDTRLDLVLSGLPPGRHSLRSYHNAYAEHVPNQVAVSIHGEICDQTSHSFRERVNDRSATLWCEFDVERDEDVVLTFSVPTEASEDRCHFVLNGLALDACDLEQSARIPTPSHLERHAPELPRLNWDGEENASYSLYFGTDRDEVANANESSSCFNCRLSNSTIAMRELLANAKNIHSLQLTKSTYEELESLNPFVTYYWRVDRSRKAFETDSLASKGDVWSFQVRRRAFPGAEGYGRFAAGGRLGRVIEVTNLNDSGAGSLRDAVESEGPRTVIFRIGGTIQLRSKLVIRNPYLTVAGETAPGGGVCVRGWTFGALGTHDVILRHIRIRVGDESGETMDGTGFASCDHMIMDHCSISWTIDEGVSSRGAKNITFQRCIVSEALHDANHRKYEAGKGHSFAASISGDIGSFHHNLIAHCAGRNWSLAGGFDNSTRFAGRLDIRNNVVFNWVHRTTDGGVKQLNFVNNFYLPGPATRVHHLLKPDTGSLEDPQQYFVEGNEMEGYPEYASDNWNPRSVLVDPGSMDRIQLRIPFCESYVKTHSARDAYNSVLSDVGANLPELDSVDRRILEEVTTRKHHFKGSRTTLPGIIDSQRDVGGWPHLESGTAAIDSDRDGMPDVWELEHALDPKSPHDANQYDEDYITNLERYLFSKAERRSTHP